MVKRDKVIQNEMRLLREACQGFAQTIKVNRRSVGEFGVIAGAAPTLAAQIREVTVFIRQLEMAFQDCGSSRISRQTDL